MKPTVLYVDDNFLKIEDFSMLLEEHFHIETESCSSNVLNRISQKSYDAIILDVLMPKIDGFALADLIESSPNYNGCPIIFRSSAENPDISKRALTHGAREFLSPYIPNHEYHIRILNKINEAKSRNNNSDDTFLVHEEMKLNKKLQTLTIQNTNVPISQTEFKFLSYLIHNRDKLIPREEIVTNVWGENFYITKNNFNTHVSNLRRKITDSSYTIYAIKGAGIKFSKKEN